MLLSLRNNCYKTSITPNSIIRGDFFMKNENDYYDGSIFWQSVLKGTIISLAGVGVMLCVFAAIMLMFDAPAAASGYFSYITVFISALLGGFFAAKFSKEKGIIVGAAVGLALFLIISLVSVIFASDIYFLKFVIRFLLCMLAAVVGGVLGVNAGHKNKFKI